MAASCASVSSVPRRPTSRTLGALFAGSAVMFSIAVLQGSTLFTAGEPAQAATEPQAETAAASSSVVGATSFASGLAGTAPAPVAPQTGEGAPGASPDWARPLSSLPIHRAPVRTLSRHAVPTSASAPGHDAHHDDFASRNGGSGHDDDGVLRDVLGYVVRK